MVVGRGGRLLFGCKGGEARERGSGQGDSATDHAGNMERRLLHAKYAGNPVATIPSPISA